MKTKRHSIKGYKINFATNTISMNYKFAKAVQDYGSPEYVLLKGLMADFPDMVAVVKAGRIIEKATYNKRLTYKNMEEHISVYKNADELLVQFEEAKVLSKPLASPYKYVSDWFNKQFPDYRDNIRSLINTKNGIELVSLPKVEDYKLNEKYA